MGPALFCLSAKNSLLKHSLCWWVRKCIITSKTHNSPFFLALLGPEGQMSDYFFLVSLQWDILLKLLSLLQGRISRICCDGGKENHGCIFVSPPLALTWEKTLHQTFPLAGMVILTLLPTLLLWTSRIHEDPTLPDPEGVLMSCFIWGTFNSQK